MVISSFFNDRKTIFVIYATSIAVWIASAFMYNYSASSAVKALDVRDFAATFLLISCVFAISVILYNFNKLRWKMLLNIMMARKTSGEAFNRLSDTASYKVFYI